MSLEIRLLSYKGNGTQGERIVRTTFRGKIEFTVCYTRHITYHHNCPYFGYFYQRTSFDGKKRLDLNMYLAEKNMKNPQPFFSTKQTDYFQLFRFWNKSFFPPY